MTETFAVLHRHMASASPHEYTAGRKTKYKVPDLIDKGAAIVMKGGITEDVQEGRDDDDIDIVPDIKDVSVDLIM